MKRCPVCSGICLANQAFCAACGAPLQTEALVDGDPCIGTVFAGKYRVEERVGEGGMAVVYRAETLDVGRSVAIKVLHRRYCEDRSIRMRFEREARVASGLNHPNCISILDFGHTPSGITFIVMEFLQGQSLARLLQAGRITVRRTVRILLQVLSCLETAHAQGVVHRDLKPANVFVLSGTDDLVKVLDFGIARIRRPGLERLTRTGMVCGTPEYMSPEQAQGREIDARSDLYAAGIMFYEMLTGERPFEGSTAAEIMGAQIHSAPTPPSKKGPDRDIPPSLDAIVLWALAKQPEERFDSAREFRRVLEEWMAVAGSTVGTLDEETLRCRACGYGTSDAVAGMQCPECGGKLEAVVRPARALDAAIPPAPSRGDVPAGRAETKPAAGTFDNVIRGPAEDLDGLEGRLPSSARTPVVPTSAGPLVGVDARMSYLEHAASAKGFNVFRFEGPPGAGKSRTAEELMSRLAAEGRRAVKVTPDPSDATEPLAAMQRLVVQLLGLPCEPVSLDDLVGPLEQAGCAEHKQGFCELFGLAPTSAGTGSPSDRRFKRAEAWRQLVVHSARTQPLVVLVDGVDRLDGGSRELILALAAMDAQAPLTLLLTHPEGFFALWPERCQHVEVSGLEPDAALNLARRLSQGRLSDAQMRLAADRSRGNPLHLKELVAYMVSVQGHEPPANLADLIGERVLRLVPEVLFCLQCASVLSDHVDPALLGEMVTAQGYELSSVQIRYLLEVLGNAGYLTLGAGGFKFAHRLYRQVVYASIPAMIRVRMHGHAAAFLARAGSPDALLAHHFWEAELPGPALPYLVRAAGRALDLLDEETAEVCYRKVLQAVKGPDATLTESHGKAWVEAVCGLVRTKLQAGHLQEARNVFEAGRRRLGRMGWDEALARIEEAFRSGPKDSGSGGA